jgi:hypothetical protein
MKKSSGVDNLFVRVDLVSQTTTDHEAMLAPHLAIHDRIAAICEKVRALNVGLRPPLPLDARVAKLILRTAPKADEDGIMCALVAKAANTHRAIRSLAVAGHGDDALSLTRVLQENAILAEWMRTKPHRIGIYALAEQVLRRWIVAATRKLATAPEVLRAVDEVEAEPAHRLAAIFGDVQTRHLFDLGNDGRLRSVTMKQAIADIALPVFLAHDGTDLPYFRRSMFVHSAAPSLRHLLTPIRAGGFFSCDAPPNPNHAVEAIASANRLMAIAVSQLCEYANLDELTEDFDDLRTLFAALPPSSAGRATVKAPLVS